MSRSNDRDESREEKGGCGMSDRNELLAFLLGAVAGGVTALLLAPGEGGETRRRLREGARDLKDTAGVKARHIVDATHAGVEHVAESARTQLGAVKDAVAEGRQAYRREVSDEN